MKQSLLGHLAFEFTQSPENLATNALSFIFNRSVAVNQAFVRLISQGAPTSPANLRFDCQICVQDEAKDTEVSTNAIADLVGVDNTGKRKIICEAKFWAGLTEHQPVTYLKRFPDASILLFIAPSKRFVLLWDELIRRCNESKMELKRSVSIADGFKTVPIKQRPVLALISWRMILNTLQHSAEADGDRETMSDIKQLQGLCDRMDENAFLPVRSDELTSDTGRRILQYCNLVDEITDSLVTLGIASVKGLKSTAWEGAYGRYMYIRRHACLLHVNCHMWNEYMSTPIWFQIWKVGRDKEWSFASEAKTKLTKLEMEEPSRLIQIKNELFVPLFIPVGNEKSQAVESLVAQVREVTNVLATI